MRKLALALAASTLLVSPALAAPGNGKAIGHEPKVCLLTFATAAEFGFDASVVKAQYVPLPIAVKLEKDATTQGIAYYGIGDLTAEQQASIDFYYPDGSSSTVVGVAENSDTKTLCLAFMDYAEGQDDDDD